MQRPGPTKKKDREKQWMCWILGHWTVLCRKISIIIWSNLFMPWVHIIMANRHNSSLKFPTSNTSTWISIAKEWNSLPISLMGELKKKYTCRLKTVHLLLRNKFQKTYKYILLTVNQKRNCLYVLNRVDFVQEMEELTHKGRLKLDPQGSYFHPDKSHSKNIQGKLILKIYTYCFLHCTSILTDSFRTFVEKRYSLLMFVCFHLYWNSTVPVSKNVKIVSIQTSWLSVDLWTLI